MTEDAEGPDAPLVLVADDEPEICELVELMLAGAGFRTAAAADGEEAVALALAHRPAVILLDLMMPGMDGYATIARLRRHASTRDIPVVMLTGQTASVFEELSVGVGAVAHVTKPFTPDLLVEVVRQALRERAPDADGGRPAPGAVTRPAIPSDPSGVAPAYALLLDALREEASEIHIEPLPEHVRVRTRVAGRLVERARLPRPLLDPVLSRLRVLAGVHDARPSEPAYVRTELDGRAVELELSFFATAHGDGVAVRLWPDGLVDLDPILGAAVDRNASDVYLIEGTPPVLKVDGVAAPIPGARALAEPDLRKLLQVVPEPQRTAFRTTNEADLSIVHPELGRFRLNCYRAMGATGMVLRRVKTEVPTFEALALPPVLGTLAMARQGLVLVVGATGSGKSTTLAAMIDCRNAGAPGHIVTIEDPVEFIHQRQQCVISQREVGVDTESYLVALQQALRQAPDVILVGELRDRDTVAVALHAAETGHLVLSTLHATNATGAVERLLNFFPPDAREAVLMQLSLMLRGIVAQRLVPHAGGSGRVAALEVMLNTPRIQALIRRGELDGLRQSIEEGGNEGLQTLDQALLALHQQKKITEEDALRFADSPQNLRLRLKGIR